MKLVSFVIPCYRSAKTIGAVTAEIGGVMDRLPQYDYEIVLVNDCSPDDTFAVIRELAAKDRHIAAVDLAKNFGQHAALMCGMRKARGDYVVCLDDDGQTPADEVGKLLEKLEEDYDVVYASYADNKRESGFRRFGSDVNRRMTEIMLGKPRELELTSYFAARRFIVDEMLRYEHCYPYVMGLVLRSTAPGALDERLYLLLGKAPAHCDLFRRLHRFHRLSLRPGGADPPLHGEPGPDGLEHHNDPDPHHRRAEPAAAGPCGRICGPGLHVCQRNAPVCGARIYPRRRRREMTAR